MMTKEEVKAELIRRLKLANIDSHEFPVEGYESSTWEDKDGEHWWYHYEHLGEDRQELCLEPNEKGWMIFGPSDTGGSFMGALSPTGEYLDQDMEGWEDILVG